MSFNSGYAEFSEEHNLDQNFGYLIAPQYEAKTFNMEKLKLLIDINSEGELNALMDSFPEIGVLNYNNHSDNLILHDGLVIILNKFLYFARKSGKSDDQIVLHKNLCVPLY
jgi:hypothetical protein